MNFDKRKNNFLKTILCGLIVAVLVTGCDKDFTEGTPFDNEASGNPTPTQSTGDKQDVTTVPGSDDITSVTEAAATSSPETTSEPETTATVTEEVISPTEQLPSPTEQDTVTATEAPTYRPDSFNLSESWNKTYLIYLPIFEGGYFVGLESKGTYDYATFSEVSEAEAKDYITLLKNSGFTKNLSESESGGTYKFSGNNEDNWNALVTYSGSTLVIGSGFKDQDSKDENKEIYSNTMLQYVPVFENGAYISSDVKNDSTMYASVIYGNVSKEDVLAYIEKLKSAGYIYGVEENYEEGSIWYFALNEESFECHAEYDGTNFKIGCGIAED